MSAVCYTWKQEENFPEFFLPAADACVLLFLTSKRPIRNAVDCDHRVIGRVGICPSPSQFPLEFSLIVLEGGKCQEDTAFQCTVTGL